MTNSPNVQAGAADCRSNLTTVVSKARCTLREYLDTLAPTAYESWWARAGAWIRKAGTGQGNPVRIKNLEKVLAFLRVLQHMLADPHVAASPEQCEALRSLLVSLEKCESLETLSFNNAWELADMLEAELLQLGDHDYVKSAWLTWPRTRIPDTVRDVVVGRDRNLSVKGNGSTLEAFVRPWLIEDQRDLAHEYRRDRAMITLRRSYLNFMAITLLLLDLAFCVFLINVQRNPIPFVPTAAKVTGESRVIEATPEGAVTTASDAMNAAAPASATTPSNGSDSTWIAHFSLLLLAMVSGAIGSVVARATKLSHQPLPSEPASGKGQEMPLGIRSLMSNWSAFFAQVMLGATAGLVIYLVFSSRLLVIEGIEAHTPAPLAVLAFIAGFSEPFLTNVVDGITRRVV